MPVRMFMVPVLPGQAEASRQFAKEVVTVRKAEHAASRKRLGWTGETVWVQANPDGSQVAIARLTMEDPDRTFAALAASKDPFDVHFKQQVLRTNGLDFNQPPTGAPPEMLFENRSPHSGHVGHLAAAFPILPGKSAKAREMARMVSGPKRQEYSAASRAAGLLTEEWWIQQTPQGDFAINYWEAENPVEAVLHSVKHPTEVDRWIFREFKDISGVDFGDIKQVPTRWPETIIDWKA